MFKVILFTTLILFLQACSTTQTKNVTKDSFNLSTTHCTKKQKKIENYRNNEHLSLVFPSLPGIIFGKISNDIVKVVHTLPNKNFVLELPHNMGNRAKKLKHEELSITPSNTKIIRLGTFHHYESMEHLGGGMFIDAISDDSYTLVYFSQPASLIGTVKNSEGEIEFKIENAKAGWNWFKYTKLSSKKSQIVLHNDPNTSIKFCAIVNDAYQI